METIIIFFVLIFTVAFMLLCLCFFLWLSLSKKYKEKIEKKFYNKLIRVCEKELIYIEYYNNVYDLSKIKEISPSLKNKGNLACGRYIYYVKPEYDTPLNRINHKLPKIQLLKNNNVWTLAHELGHHFCIKKNDFTEKGADKYIKILARRHLDIFDRIILGIEIFIYSR